ncbi:hypothetical protein [Mycolicibacterium neworleansense]|uniref:Uncharacterized protein n=1 Tax=Mycolicibacterium neworleansense TaxID=146018 RepID=A0A0H5RPY8_9MYCO|nr:hypothetical protein [Mycolicibacterium neworleansense]CRZ15537.1 hypothetical protein BN2156_02399 [Mycolicibacterium neworleansense]
MELIACELVLIEFALCIGKLGTDSVLFGTKLVERYCSGVVGA